MPFRLCRTGQAITEAWKQDTFQWPTQNKWKRDFLTTRAGHSWQDRDVLVITLLLEVIVINIIIRIIRIIIIVRVFFIAVSNVITKLIPTFNLAAKITAFTSCLIQDRSISLAQPGLTTPGTVSAAGCSHACHYWNPFTLKESQFLLSFIATKS